jgi:hypothetical protein
MKLGAENKKAVYALVAVAVVGGYVVYSSLSSDSPTPRPVAPAAAPSPDTSDAAPPSAPAKSAGSGPDISRAQGPVSAGRTQPHSKSGEFHPVLREKQKEKRVVDIGSIDPTIRFDLLDQAMKVPPAGGERDLFQILKGPPIKETAALRGPEPLIGKIYGPPTPRPPAPPPPKIDPPPTPIPFKFYGVSSIHPDGTRTAYFIIPNPEAGDEILMANEGDVLKKRFKIVQITLDKVLVEDIQDKRRQPLTMEKENTQ